MSIHYLTLGHLAQDLTPSGPRLGGTVAYAALTAEALGYPAGILTAHGAGLDLRPLKNAVVISAPSNLSTTFENIYSAEGRTQFLRARAEALTAAHIPTNWFSTPVIHVAPLAQEIEPRLIEHFVAASPAFIGLTPQGWLRQWDATGRVSKCDWAEALATLPHVNAAVISIEDIRGEWAIAEHWATAARVLVVTEGAHGCTVYTKGEGARQFPASPQPEVDPTGAGDIFAAAFFINLYETHDVGASARFANRLAALSITRAGLDGIPTPDEVALCRINST